MVQVPAGLVQKFIMTGALNMAVENQIVRLDAIVIVLWKFGIMSLPNMTVMDTDIMRNLHRKILIQGWDWSV